MRAVTISGKLIVERDARYISRDFTVEAWADGTEAESTYQVIAEDDGDDSTAENWVQVLATALRNELEISALRSELERKALERKAALQSEMERKEER